MAPTSRVARLPARLFKPRDLIIRERSRTIYVALSAPRQMLAAGSLAVLMVWALGNGLALVFGQDLIARTEARVADGRASYLRLSTAVQQHLHVPGLQAASALAALPQLVDALASERSQLVHTNLMLHETLRATTAELAAATAQQQSLRSAVRHIQFSLDLAEQEKGAASIEGARLGAALRAARAESALAYRQQAVLEEVVRSMRLDRAAAAQMRHILRTGHSRLHGRIGSLEKRLAGTRRYTAALRMRLADSDRALARAAGPWAVQRARRNGLDLIDFLFPMHQLPEGANPEPALVLAIIRQESRFSPTAVSPAGATGLMQLMPTTAEHVARKLDIRFDLAKLSTDIEFNTTLGRAYLEQLLRRFDGSYVLAVAAYNAGPNRIAEWIDQFGDPRDGSIDPEEWVRQIPIRETRLYVQAVLLSLAVYRQRLGDPVPLQSEAELALKFSAADLVR